MQEEVENRTVNLAISTTKLTGRTLVNAFRRYIQQRDIKPRDEPEGEEKPVGKQSVKDLIRQDQGATNIEISKTDLRGFQKILHKYGVDYAITKDASQTPPKFLVFFKARDSDVLTAAFKEYSASLLQKQRKPSVLKQLHRFKDLIAAMPQRVRHKAKEDRSL